MMCQSAALREAARTRTSTWPADGSGRVTSRTESTSGPPYDSCTTAVIRAMP
jgi:hypothetical protein